MAQLAVIAFSFAIASVRTFADVFKSALVSKYDLILESLNPYRKRSLTIQNDFT